MPDLPSASMDTLRQWFGVELGMVGWKEKVVSASAGDRDLRDHHVSRDLVGSTGAAMLIGSMGASAVLFFAVPHGRCRNRGRRSPGTWSSHIGVSSRS